jgi:TonB family protein
MALAASFALAPMAAGDAPALAQDFSITNPENPVRVEGAVLGPDWIRQLQAWWDKHAFYPGEAVQKNVSGTVKVHIVVHPDGEVSTIHLVDGAGSKYLNNAAYQAFRDAHLHPFPPGTPAPQADVYITLHYVLTSGPASAEAASKRPFTVTNKPVEAANTSSLLPKTCSGILVISPFGELDSGRGWREWAKAIFYRTPEGQPRFKFWTAWGAKDVPVNELDGSAGWLGPRQPIKGGYNQLRFSLWPAGPDHVAGSVVNIYSGMTDDGTIDLTCAPEQPEQTQRDQASALMP